MRRHHSSQGRGGSKNSSATGGGSFGVFFLGPVGRTRNSKRIHPSLLCPAREKGKQKQSKKMRRRHLAFLPCCCCCVFLLLVLAAAGASAPAKAKAVSPVVAAEFVRRSCRSTRYPRVCESTLLPCAPAVGRSPRRLARAALVVGADRASNCSAYLRSGGGDKSASAKGGGAMKDCAELSRDAEERLRQSAAEMERMGRAGSPRFAWHLSNVQTWASAALTDTSTCLDSLAAGDKDAAAVRRRVTAVAQATSNALALVNRLDPQPHTL
ncbi:hypothetical protein EJB05_46891, partial [Eragrostis curvula]